MTPDVPSENTMAHIFTKLNRYLAASSVALAVLAMSSTAVAQPNPFDDYEEGTPAIPVDDAAPADDAIALPPAPDPGSEEPSGVAPRSPSTYVVGQWRWSAGLGMQFAYTGTSNQLLDGSDRANRTLFLTLAPRGGVFVIDQLEATLSLGLLSKLTAREGNSSVTENNFFFELGAHYHIPVSDSGFAIIPGVGMGGYFGGSSREFTIDGAQVDESTSTRGFLLNGYIGAAYQPSENWRLRSGIAVGALFGSETVKSQDQKLSASAVHVGLPIELSYVF